MAPSPVHVGGKTFQNWNLADLFFLRFLLRLLLLLQRHIINVCLTGALTYAYVILFAAQYQVI
jgi:hypothetical protein